MIAGMRKDKIAEKLNYTEAAVRKERKKRKLQGNGSRQKALKSFRNSPDWSEFGPILRSQVFKKRTA